MPAATTNPSDQLVVDYWFDPICPFAWLTSRWLTEVAAQRAITINWHLMSLGILNESPDAPPPVQEYTEVARGPVRVFASVRAEHGDEVVGALYTSVGTALHREGGTFEPSKTASGADFLATMTTCIQGSTDAVAKSLADLGLPTTHLAAAHTASWDWAIEQSHEQVPVGQQRRELIGVPTVSISGAPGFFGPVLTELPDPERAVELFDAFVTVLTEPGFYEVKRVSDRPHPDSGIR